MRHAPEMIRFFPVRLLEADPERSPNDWSSHFNALAELGGRGCVIPAAAILSWLRTHRSHAMAWTEITRLKYRRDGLRYASDTTDEEWAVIEPHMPPPAS